MSTGRLPALGLGAACLFLVTLGLQDIRATDFWWQLRTGELVLEEGLPTHDTLSFTVQDHEWIEMRWLYCVLLFLGYELGGVGLLVLVKTLMLAGTATLLLWRRTAARTPEGLLVLGLTTFAAADRFMLRPEIVTYLLIATFLVLLEGVRDNRFRKRLWILPALQVLWTNAHTLFVFGPVLAWGFFVGSAAQTWWDGREARQGTPLFHRGLLVTAIGVTLACFLNPYGLRGALFPFLLFTEIQGEGVLQRSVLEFQSPLDIDSWGYGMWAAFGLALISAGTFLVRRGRPDLPRIGLWAALLYLGLEATRNLGLFAWVAGWAAMRNLEDAQQISPTRLPLAGAPRRARIASGMLVAALLAGAWYVGTDRYYVQMGYPQRTGMGVLWRNTPAAAVDFLRESSAAPQAFHAMADGSYLAWAAHERFPVFIDGRLEVYGEGFVEASLRVNADSWNEIADRWDIQTCMIHRELQTHLIDTLVSSPDWVLIHVDPRDLVFVRKAPGHAELIAEHAIDLSRPWRPRGREPEEEITGWRAAIGTVGTPWHSLGMAKVFLRLGAVAPAEPYLVRAVDRFPDHVEAVLLLAQVRRFQKRDGEAEALLGGLAIPDEMRGKAALLLGQLLNQDRRFAEARTQLLAATATLPENPDAWEQLGYAYAQLKKPTNALQAYNWTITYAPERVGAWINMGRIREKNNLLRAAERDYMEALRRDPRRVEVYNYLGVVRAKQGNKNGARDAFQRVLAIDPENAAARRNLDRLGKL